MKKVLLALVLLLLAALAVTGLGIVMSLAVDGGGGGPRVLVWRLEGPLLDQSPPDLFPLFGYEPPLSLAEVYRALRSARSDEDVRGLAVYVQETAFGLAKAQEIRRQFELLRRAGKFVDCYLEAGSEGGNATLAYYLATACDEIHLAPAGDFNLLGLYAQGIFFRGSLDKLRVEPDFRSVGAYKSAVETYTRREFSAAAEEALSDLLDRDYEMLVAAFAERLGTGEQEVRALIDGAPYTADAALERGLVDHLSYPDQFRDRLTDRLGEEPEIVGLREYRGRRERGGRIAVVFAQGTIVRGASGVEPWTREAFLGADDLGSVLDSLADDDRVDAVVLRVDSPGGSALASDLILREVETLAAAKPVVASLSDVAASGGYYIASKATAIVAEPATITGSIGVYGGKLVTRRFEEELLGLTRDTLKRGANADLYSSLAPFTEEQAERLDALMERVYASFVGHVAEGRDLTREEVLAVAEGRVWAGVEAVRLGLVDELGGLDRAVARAAEAAGLDPAAGVRLEFHPRGKDLLDWLFERGDPWLPAALAPLAARLSPEVPGPAGARPGGLLPSGRRRGLLLLQLPPEVAGLARPF